VGACDAWRASTTEAATFQHRGQLELTSYREVDVAGAGPISVCEFEMIPDPSRLDSSRPDVCA